MSIYFGVKVQKIDYFLYSKYLLAGFLLEIYLLIDSIFYKFCFHPVLSGRGMEYFINWIWMKVFQQLQIFLGSEAFHSCQGFSTRYLYN